MSELMEKRYKILKMVQVMQPVGRRLLSQTIGLSERVLRKETDFLKEQGFVHFTTAGMNVSVEGEELLESMQIFMHQWLGLNELELQLQNKLGLKKVQVVPGDSDEQPYIIKDLGLAAVQQLKANAEEEAIVAVAGGSSMAAVADAMTRNALLKTLHYVPARGGLGEDVDYQANTICAQMAMKTGGSYRLLHVPDELSEEAYESLLNDNQIKELIQTIRSARIVVHGIGEATTMAKRRKATSETINKIEENKAVAEAFGYYFNQQGDVVHKVRTIGIQLDDIREADHIIAVAGGRHKALAILAFLKHGVHDVLITDEGAAKAILSENK